MSAVVQYQEPVGSDLEQWGRDLEVAYAMAVRLVTTSFVPESYRGKPEEAAAAIVTGAELGLSPMAALRSIDIIQGTPGMRAIALRALVQSHGHEIWVHESTTQRAVVKGRRKGQDTVETSTWDIPRAQGLKLTGKPNWQNQPIAMLLARATSECARLVAADVLLGIPYSIEELQDEAAVEPVKDAPVRRPSSTTRRKPLPEKAPAEEPALPDAETEAEAAPAEPVAGPPVEDERDDDEAEIERARRAALDAFADQQQSLGFEPGLDWGDERG